jgi:hypothetical protein
MQYSHVKTKCNRTKDMNSEQQQQKNSDLFSLIRKGYYHYSQPFSETIRKRLNDT